MTKKVLLILSHHSLIYPNLTKCFSTILLILSCVEKVHYELIHIQIRVQCLIRKISFKTAFLLRKKKLLLFHSSESKYTHISIHLMYAYTIFKLPPVRKGKNKRNERTDSLNSAEATEMR